MHSRVAVFQRIERERTFAAAGNPGQADELIPRQDEGNIAQVVLAGPLDDDIRCWHEPL